MRNGIEPSVCRGNLVFFHPGAADDDDVGRSLQRYIDESLKIKFRSAPGDIYINNNHRVLHGRTAFDDSSRRYIRFLYWFLEPFPAPQELMCDASFGASQFANKLRGQNFWVRQHLGVDAPQQCESLAFELRNALNDFLNPRNSGEWFDSNFRRSRAQEVMLSAFWNILCQKDFEDAEILEICRRLMTSE